MSESDSTERLRRGALAMLADGNAPEAVAHVLALPLEAVQAWAGTGEPVAAPRAPAALHALPPIHFDEELSHALPATSRLIIVVVGLGVAAGVCAMAARFALDGHPLDGLQGLVVAFGFLAMSWQAMARSIVLGADEVVMPGFFSWQAIAYADIDDYRLKSGKTLLGSGVLQGQWLTLFSRRPGARPMSTFFFEGKAVDGRIFDRLGDVVRANRAAAAAAASADARRA